MMPVPFSALAAEFMEGYEPPLRAKTTCRMMRQTVRELGADSSIRSSQDLSPAAVFRWLKRCPKPTPITAACHLRNIRTLCRYAVARGNLTACPFTFDSKLKKLVSVRKEARQRHHSQADIEHVLGHLGRRAGDGWEEHRLYSLASLVCWTGIRALEAQYAEVKDFDLSEGFFRVEHKPEHRLKTDASERDVPLAPALVDVLRRWLPRTLSRWAFPGVLRKGPWVNGSAGKKPLDRMKAEAASVGVLGFTFLSLRHSFITHGRGAWGINELQIQQIAGHTTVNTQKHYLGRDTNNLRSAARLIAFKIPLTTEGESGGKVQAQA